MIFSPTSNLHPISRHFCRNIWRNPKCYKTTPSESQTLYFFVVPGPPRMPASSSPPRMMAETSLGSGIPKATIASWGGTTQPRSKGLVFFGVMVRPLSRKKIPEHGTGVTGWIPMKNSLSGNVAMEFQTTPILFHQDRPAKNKIPAM